MLAFVEELAIGIAVSLALRAIGSAAEFLFAPEREAKPERAQTCSHCGSVASADAPRNEVGPTEGAPA
jgi:hypothetical protein